MNVRKGLKGLAHRYRNALLQQLKIKSLYQRSHTSSGVWRRRELCGTELEPAMPKSHVSEKSRANLLNYRQRRSASST
jgi:hypothetical protein